jgi:tripartite-type tricarboxylate transporter receptor subunit TctC
VPYLIPVEAANDLAACRVQVYKSAYTIACPQVQSGKIKVLVAANTARASATRDILTVAEAGYPAR